MKYKKEDHFIIFETIFQSCRNKKIGEFYCVLDGIKHTSLRSFANSLRKFNYTSKQYYDEFFATYDEKICVECKKNPTSFKNISEGYNTYCSSSCNSKSEKHRKIVRNRFVNNEEKKLISNKKRKIAMSMKTDDELKDISRRIVETTKRNHGEDYLSNRVKKQWVNTSEEKKKLIVEKVNQTKLKNGTMGFDIFKNTNKKITIDGKLYYCQGYEDAVLHFLHKCDLINNFVTGKDVPRILSEVNKSGVYRPDIYIEELNLLIEVKSGYTYGGDFKKYTNSIKKQIDSINQGYNHVLFVIKDVKKDRNLNESDKECFKNYLNMLISSQALNEKVQRLSGDSEYRPNAIGSGSARVPV